MTSTVQASDGTNLLMVSANGMVPVTDLLTATSVAPRTLVTYNYQDKLVSIAGYGSSSRITYLNSYPSGLPIEQIGYDPTGARTVNIHHGRDGAKIVAYFTNGLLASQSGYAADGHMIWNNSFDGAGRLIEQDGFNASGVKTTEIDRAAGGAFTVAHYSDTGMLTDRIAYDGAGTLQYALVAGGGGYVVTSGVGGQTLSAGPGATTYAIPTIAASNVNAYDVIEGFRSGTDHIDLSQVAFGDVVVTPHGNDWTSIFFQASMLGNIAVHGTVAADDLLLGAGAHLTIG